MDDHASDRMGAVMPDGNARAPRTGLAQAGEILLLVGWIVRAVTVLFFVIYLVAMSAFLATLFDVATDAPGPEGGAEAFAGMAGLMLVMFLVMIVLFGVSLVLGIVAWRRARAGEYRTPGILGIVAAMLPPLDVIFLLGGIFLLVCDEAKAEQADARAGNESDVRAVTRQP